MSNIKNQSPPVKIGALAAGGNQKPLQHLKSPLNRQGTGGLGIAAVSSIRAVTETPVEVADNSIHAQSNLSQLRRESVANDPLLLMEESASFAIPKQTLTEQAVYASQPPPLPPKPQSLPSSIPPPAHSFTPHESLQSSKSPTPPAKPSALSSPALPASSSFTHASASASIDEETALFLSTCRTPPLDPLTVQPSLQGLQTFAHASAWKYVVELSQQLLSEKKASSSTRDERGGLSFLMRMRLEGLFRMKMFDELNHEASAILETEKLVDVGKRDLDIVLCMQLLLAEVLSVTGRSEEAATQLYTLKERLVVDTSTPNAPYWLWKTTNSIVNCAIRQRQWRTAIKELLTLLDMIRVAKAAAGDDSKLMVARAEIVVICRLSRAMLQIGATKGALGYCQQANARLGESLLAQDAVAQHVEVSKGLFLFSQDKFDEALNIFANVISTEHALLNGTARADSSTRSCDTAVGNIPFPYFSAIELEESLLSVAVCNYSVAALHLRRMTVSVQKLESLIREDPVRYLIDPIVFNLCTLYELSCSPDVSTQKKKILQRIASMYLVSDPILNWKSLRLA